MLPLGHLFIGYAAFSVFERVVRKESPTAAALPWLLLGTQLPDLIDKPLAWWVGILPSGRSLAHSLVFAVPVVVILCVWLSRRDRVAGADGFAIGYASHLLTDVISDLERTTFLLWPVTPAPVYDSEVTGELLPSLAELSAGMMTESLLGLVVAALWIADGRPGLGYLRSIKESITS